MPTLAGCDSAFMPRASLASDEAEVSGARDCPMSPVEASQKRPASVAIAKRSTRSTTTPTSRRVIDTLSLAPHSDSPVPATEWAR